MKAFSDVILERRFFAIVDGESEFHWVLKEFGIPEDQWNDIDSVTISGEIVEVSS